MRAFFLTSQALYAKLPAVLISPRVTLFLVLTVSGAGSSQSQVASLVRNLEKHTSLQLAARANLTLRI